MAEPTVTATTGRELGAAALVGAFGAWLFVRTVERATGETPQLPWVGVAMLGALAIAMGWLAWSVRRAATKPGSPPVENRRALVHLALAKSALLGGAALAAGYLVFAYLFVDHLDAVGPRQRVIRGVVSAVVAVAIALAGWVLEKACRGRWGDEPPTPEDRD
ncbi:DUF3180 domain-containing protein [Mariniluteicoccus flavus]